MATLARKFGKSNSIWPISSLYVLRISRSDCRLRQKTKKMWSQICQFWSFSGVRTSFSGQEARPATTASLANRSLVCQLRSLTISRNSSNNSTQLIRRFGWLIKWLRPISTMNLKFSPRSRIFWKARWWRLAMTTPRMKFFSWRTRLASTPIFGWALTLVRSSMCTIDFRIASTP